MWRGELLVSSEGKKGEMTDEAGKVKAALKKAECQPKKKKKKNVTVLCHSTLN